MIIGFAAVTTVIWYLKSGGLQIIGDLTQHGEGAPVSLPKLAVTPTVKRHLVFLGGIIVILLAWGYYLKIYGLLYSNQGPAFGASYTDVHIKILANKALAIISLFFALVMIINAFKFRAKTLLITGAVWIGSILLFTNAIPMLVQKFVVKPNELAKETPYIAHNINFTRKAYNLNKIKEVNFEVNDKLHLDDIRANNATIKNIRIWDERPLLRTYRQIQAIRLYYDFQNVDVDRYLIDGEYRQVMLAAREMLVSQLPPKAKTWVNQHLTYTHGYGLVCGPVNEVTSEGLPVLFVEDIPPSYKEGLRVDRPEIYYGEKTDEYVLVNTSNEEFDYPKGDKNVYTTYQGEGGVPIKSFFRRLLFAVEFLDPQILFTTSISDQSRLMFKRRIDSRASAIAPFLEYDRDPYMVVSEGRLLSVSYTHLRAHET